MKASTETHQAAGDKANDAVRADGNQLRARVVGEGGNLGLTQLGRVEFARAGGRINTDAIDNSAGVDTSDHEVNLKILLDRAVASGEIDRQERNELLQSVTDDVAAHVLRDNYGQNVLLGMARKLSPALVSVHQRVIQLLEESGELDRAIEFLPSDKEIEQREIDGVGLVSPENSVLIAYVKIALMRNIEASTVPDEPWFQRALAGYFPKPIADRFGSSLGSHPLHREIITTVVVNDMINRSGTTFVHRAMEETGGDPAQVVRAYSVVREIFGLSTLWGEIEALDNVVTTEAQHAGYHEIRRLVDRADALVRRRPVPDQRRRRRDRPVRSRPSPSWVRASPPSCAAPSWQTSSRSRSACPRSACPPSSRRTWPNCSARSCCSTSSRSPMPASIRRPRSPSCTSRCPTSSTSTRC